MNMYTVSLIIFLVVLAVSLLFGFSDVGRNQPLQNRNMLHTTSQQADAMPSGLRIVIE